MSIFFRKFVVKLMELNMYPSLKNWTKEKFDIKGLKREVCCYTSPDGEYKISRSWDVDYYNNKENIKPSSFWYVKNKIHTGSHYTMGSIAYAYSMSPDDALDKLNLWLNKRETVREGKCDKYQVVYKGVVENEIIVFNDGYMFDLKSNLYRGEMNGSNYYNGGYRGELVKISEENIRVFKFVNDEFLFDFDYEIM